MATDATDNANKVGTVIAYDAPWALKAAQDYKNQIAAQLGHKLKNRPYTAAEQKLSDISIKLQDAVAGKRSLPQDYASSRPFVPPSSGGIKTDPYLKKTGAEYSGWHRTSPVDMNAALDDDAWVKKAYRSLLGREADPAGLAYWKGDLASGQTRDQVVASMRLQPEYRDKFIGEAYKNLLGRDVGLEGIDYWSKAMEAGESEDSIIANIKRSDEYGRRQQNFMRDAISPKSPVDLLNETYDDQIAQLGRAKQKQLDRVQKDSGTTQDYTPLLTTQESIYTQDPEASPLSSVNYLATVKDPTPNIWTKALGDAGKKALANVDISSLVDRFINTLT